MHSVGTLAAASGCDSDMATAGVGGRRPPPPPRRDWEEGGGRDDDPLLTRLLHRLRREHGTNFGRGGGDGGGIGAGGGGVDRNRVMYLLEASAGNVGLASALYWEDYLANVVERRGGQRPPPPREEEEDGGGGVGRGPGPATNDGIPQAMDW